MDQNGSFQLRQVLEKEELFVLAARIKNNFPYCIQMYNTVLINARGLSDGFMYEFYVPKDYPESHIIIWRTLVQRRGMSLYCTEDEVPLLIKLIKGKHFLSLLSEAPLYIKFLSNYQVDPVLEALQEILQKPLQKHVDKAFVYASQQDNILRCPAGMKVQRLGRAGVRHMLEPNPYWKNTSLDLVCNLAENLPALGLYQDSEVSEGKVIALNELEYAEPEDIPISCVGTSPYGSISMLRTEDNYKRRGLASLLVEIMGRLHMADGYLPHAVVEAENDASARVFRKVSGWKESHTIYLIIPPEGTIA
ncbi:uncharacterized protein [Palaemon carinicauda]|uniref:uncharacterized protein n=1 Tax=Palaemon carinicauda TaxID=392227 RepID=UPI0035B664B8